MKTMSSVGVVLGAALEASNEIHNFVLAFARRAMTAVDNCSEQRL